MDPLRSGTSGSTDANGLQPDAVRKLATRSLGANVGATRANDFPRQADDYGQAADNLASSRTDPNDDERDTGNLHFSGQKA